MRVWVWVNPNHLATDAHRRIIIDARRAAAGGVERAEEQARAVAHVPARAASARVAVRAALRTATRVAGRQTPKGMRGRARAGLYHGSTYRGAKPHLVWLCLLLSTTYLLSPRYYLLLATPEGHPSFVAGAQ